MLAACGTEDVSNESASAQCGPQRAIPPLTIATDKCGALWFDALTFRADDGCHDDTTDVISVTLSGTGPYGTFNLCMSRPDLLASGERGMAHLAFRCSATCTVSAMIAVRGDGVCDNGLNAAGFALTIEPTLGSGGCYAYGQSFDVNAMLEGTVAVTP